MAELTYKVHLALHKNVESIYFKKFKLLTLTFTSPLRSIHYKDLPFHSLASLPVFLISSRPKECWLSSLSLSAILVSLIHFLTSMLFGCPQKMLSEKHMKLNSKHYSKLETALSFISGLPQNCMILLQLINKHCRSTCKYKRRTNHSNALCW